MNDFKEENLSELGRFPLYLCSLTSECAIDINNYSLGRSEDLQSVYKLTKILEIYRLSDNPRIPMSSQHNFPYWSLWRAFLKSGKEFRYDSQVALEMRLLRTELMNIKNLNKENLNELSNFLCEFSRQIGLEIQNYRQPYRLVA